MSLKLPVACAVLCVLSVCCGNENSTQELSRRSSSNETLEPNSDEWLTDAKDLDKDASMWRFWRPFRNLGQKIFNKKFTRSPTKKESLLGGLHNHRDRPTDSKRTVTRRGSSLIVKPQPDTEPEVHSPFQGLSSAPYTSDDRSTTASFSVHSKRTVQDEIIALMFESMLGSIVGSWETIDILRKEDSFHNMEVSKTASEMTNASKKKKGLSAKASKTKRSRSKLEIISNDQASRVCWWSGADEKAVIRFRNGNIYEGHISMKCMNGEGRFQWADGTVYMGQFKNNEMHGKGTIQWKDDTWYQGEFRGNLRHGKGLFVDSRTQRSYAGGWHYGMKHGEGVIYYSRNFKNSYDGQWIYNERYGYGSREYSESSGFKGEWDRNIREGKGLMIWPNNDFYRGDWKNGVMSGYGIYIWDAYYNNTMALPSINAFRGMWDTGKRNGYGILNLGLGLGSHYKGEFQNNFKHGQGKFVTNNGLIIQSKTLFYEDSIGPLTYFNCENSQELKRCLADPYRFDICDNTVGLTYHIDQALQNIDKQTQIRNDIINTYIENNKLATRKTDSTRSSKETLGPRRIEDLIAFEEMSLRKALSCYETDLLNIYNKYATICNTEEIGFTPILIRLFLWQLYYDCNVHEKGLTLVEIDNIFHQNPDWLSRTPHNPFEKVYFWQFIHSMISVASRLYAKKEYPGPKPDTILARAFRTFMETDVIPCSAEQRGRLVNYGKFVPLKATYKLYGDLGEPHTVRDFLCAVRRPSHYRDRPQPKLVDAPESCLPLGRNVYIFGDELTFIVDDDLPDVMEEIEDTADLKLFNFGNLSTKTIIEIFAKIFPEIRAENKIMNLEIKITFYEFFEAFIACTERSINVKAEELVWREKFLTPPDRDIATQVPSKYTTKMK